jgi:hypothetical protein
MLYIHLCTNPCFLFCRKRTRKTTTKAGRKKAKKGTGADATLTPRTRGALAKEAAAKARREAEEAELKAVVAKEVAQAAAREELQATRDQSPAARRFCSSILQHVHVNLNC